METSDPPNDTPGALNQVVLTPHDIPRILREGSFVKGSLDHLSDETRSWQPCAQRMQNSEPGSLPQRSWGKRNGGKGYEILNFPPILVMFGWDHQVTQFGGSKNANIW